MQLASLAHYQSAECGNRVPGRVVPRVLARDSFLVRDHEPRVSPRVARCGRCALWLRPHLLRRCATDGAATADCNPPAAADSMDSACEWSPVAQITVCASAQENSGCVSMMSCQDCRAVALEACRAGHCLPPAHGRLLCTLPCAP